MVEFLFGIFIVLFLGGAAGLGVMCMMRGGSDER